MTYKDCYTINTKPVICFNHIHNTIKYIKYNKMEKMELIESENGKKGIYEE